MRRRPTTTSGDGDGVTPGSNSEEGLLTPEEVGDVDIELAKLIDRARKLPSTHRQILILIAEAWLVPGAELEEALRMFLQG